MTSAARLELRLMDLGDQSLYVALYSCTETLRFFAKAQNPEQAARGFAAACRMNRETPAQRRFWVIRDTQADQDVGLIGLVWDGNGGAELGVILPPAAQARGYASEAIRALYELAFAGFGLESLHTCHAPANVLAYGLMSKLGFEPLPDEVGLQSCRWRLSRQRWLAKMATST